MKNLDHIIAKGLFVLVIITTIICSLYKFGFDGFIYVAMTICAITTILGISLILGFIWEFIENKIKGIE